MMRSIYLATMIAAFCVASTGTAQEGGQTEIPRGLWKTEPDSRGEYFLVRTRGCGRALCARVQRAKKRGGYDTPSSAVGQKVLLRMQPQPDGSFFGEYQDGIGRSFKGSRAEVTGRILRLRACSEHICKDSIWTRVK
jgi:uncharacterized protein (DUF2147 family)